MGAGKRVQRMSDSERDVVTTASRARASYWSSSHPVAGPARPPPSPSPSPSPAPPPRAPFRPPPPRYTVIIYYIFIMWYLCLPHRSGRQVSHDSLWTALLTSLVVPACEYFHVLYYSFVNLSYLSRRMTTREAYACWEAFPKFPSPCEHSQLTCEAPPLHLCKISLLYYYS